MKRNLLKIRDNRINILRTSISTLSNIADDSNRKKRSNNDFTDAISTMEPRSNQYSSTFTTDRNPTSLSTPEHEIVKIFRKSHRSFHPRDCNAPTFGCVSGLEIIRDKLNFDPLPVRKVRQRAGTPETWPQFISPVREKTSLSRRGGRNAGKRCARTMGKRANEKRTIERNFNYRVKGVPGSGLGRWVRGGWGGTVARSALK